jgi:hypothetical protein
MSDSVLPVGDDRDLEEYITRLLRSNQFDWHIEDELIDIVKRLAPPVEDEEEFRERLRARLASARSGPGLLPLTLGRYIAESRSRLRIVDLSKRLGVSAAFLLDLEADQVGWESLVRAFPAKQLARLIVELKLDVEQFIRLMFTQAQTASGLTLARTASDLGRYERARLQRKIQPRRERRLSPGAPKVQQYLAELRAEVEQSGRAKGPEAT